MYPGTALVVATTGAVALAALYPVAALLAPGGGRLASRLRFSSLDPSLAGLPVGIPRTTVAMAQAATVEELFAYLVALAAASGVVALLTLLLLWFARAGTREGEIAVRRAVGASRRVLLGAALLEGIAVFLAAGGLGLPAGLGLAALAGETWPGTLAPAGGGAGLLLLLGLGAVLLLGAEFPALFASRRAVTEVEATPVAFFFPALLQLATCLVALTTGALLLRHVTARAPAASLPAGRVYAIAPDGGPGADRAAAYATLLARLPAAPGASLTAPGTLLGLGPVARVTTDCGNCLDGNIYLRFMRPLATHHFVSADTFRLLGIRLVEGRLLDANDRAGAAPVAVVSQSLANRYFENGAPLGRGIQLGEDRTRWYTVVGVVADRTGAGFGAGRLPPRQVYLSVLQAPPPVAELFLPGEGRPGAGALLAGGRPVAELVARDAAPRAWFGRWLGIGGLLMLLVAATGIFTFARVWVRSLRLALGLRRAAGARRRQLLGVVLGQAALVGAGGVLLGAWFGPAVWLSLPEVFPGLPAWDPVLLIGIGLGLVALMVAGALGPALRAARAAPAGLLAGAEES